METARQAKEGMLGKVAAAGAPLGGITRAGRKGVLGQKRSSSPEVLKRTGTKGSHPFPKTNPSPPANLPTPQHVTSEHRNGSVVQYLMYF